MVLGDDRLSGLAGRLVGVPGVIAVLVGGSRARDDHLPESDVDLGLYYRGQLDVATVGELANAVGGPPARVTNPGEWGPWVDGGGWIEIAGTAVDWIYRDVDRVQAAWVHAKAGRFSFHAQTGHPFGVPDFAYAGEVGLSVVLADPTGELSELHRVTTGYPPALGAALVGRLWEATFLLDVARKAGCRPGLLMKSATSHEKRWRAAHELSCRDVGEVQPPATASPPRGASCRAVG